MGAQSGFDQFKDGLPNMTGSELRSRLPGRDEASDPTPAPVAELMDTVTRLQLEVESLKFGPVGQSTLGGPTSLVRSKPMVFTSTKVPKFAGVTSWEQYRQVFDAIAQSNGWDDATAALQLLSHLKGDVLNVALMVPEARRATRTGLVGALTEHYGSPGRLADNRLPFQKTTRKEGELGSVNFRHSTRDIGCQSLRRHGPHCATPYYM